MQIPTYQIYNVLKQYIEQIRRKINSSDNSQKQPFMDIEQFIVRTQGKREFVIDKVATDIIKKITHDVYGKSVSNTMNQLTQSPNKNDVFTYMSIDKSQKKKHIINVDEDTSSL
ncbi:MAG: hypothetical protein HQK77_09495 [Desulfobacterales bacterium]|nr:hypothetical protein [Desulfobacterales bacterium]